MQVNIERDFNLKELKKAAEEKEKLKEKNTKKDKSKAEWCKSSTKCLALELAKRFWEYSLNLFNPKTNFFFLHSFCNN